MRHTLGIIGAILCLWAGQAGAATTTQPAAASEALSPTLVTLHVKNAVAKTVVEDLARQAGIKTDVSDWVWQRVKGTVTLDVDRQPFWPVMLQVCRQAGLTVVESWTSKLTLNNAHGKEADRPYKVQNQFVVIAKDAIRTHSVDYGAPADIQTSFNIHFDVLVDPHLHVLSASGQPQVLSVRDDKGHFLAVPNQKIDFFRTPPFHQNWLWNCTLPLQYHRDIGKTITIRALMLFKVVQRIDSWEIPNILTARNTSRIFPGGTYHVQGLQKSGPGSYQLTFTVNYDPNLFQGQINDSPLTSFQSISKAIALLDNKGHAWRSTGGGGGGGAGKLTYNLNFQQAVPSQQPLPGPPAKLVWNIPAEMRDLVVPVEFDNLVIP